MTTVRYLEQAHLDVLAAVEFYESEALGLGAEFLDELDHAIQAVRETPNIGSPYVAETRRIVLRRFPFTVVYDVTQDTLIIVAVAHHRRKPGYWSHE